MTTTQDSNNNYLEGLLRQFHNDTVRSAIEEHNGRIVEFAERAKDVRSVYEAKINSHILETALELIEQTHYLNEDGYQCNVDELRQAFKERFGSKEESVGRDDG